MPEEMLLSAAHLGFKMFSFSSWWWCCRCRAGPAAVRVWVLELSFLYSFFQVKNQDGKGNLLFSFKIWINVF